MLGQFIISSYQKITSTFTSIPLSTAVGITTGRIGRGDFGDIFVVRRPKSRRHTPKLLLNSKNSGRLSKQRGSTG
jgi:hypothetical protein